MHNLSIRGRVAFAAACVEIAMQQFQITHGQARAFLETLWSFCLEEDLLEWEARIQALHPIHWQDTALSHLDARVQPALQDLFADAIAVGTRNLYSDYRSLETEECLADVRQHMQALNLELPDLELFRFSKASEAKGWGVAFDPNELRTNLKRGIL
jgi:hypothetical protein